jgi:hypothetical protein
MGSVLIVGEGLLEKRLLEKCCWFVRDDYHGAGNFHAGRFLKRLHRAD